MPKEIDKGRKERLWTIPTALMMRLKAFVGPGEMFNDNKAYNRRGEQESNNQPPSNPRHYVLQNSATMLNKKLKAAGTPSMFNKKYNPLPLQGVISKKMVPTRGRG